MKKDFTFDRPFEQKPYGGGSCAIFRKIACVGDSLASGELEIVRGEERRYLDLYDYSWGQFLGRMTGAKVYNFSRGGMSASEYTGGWAEENGCFDEEKKCQAYVIALGVNDLLNMGQEIGGVADIGGDKKTFARYYSEIVLRYKKIEPNAKFFFVTMPRQEIDDAERTKKKEQLVGFLYELSETLPNCYVLDFYKYAPLYDAEFVRKYFYNGHMNASGYRLTAEYMVSGIHSIVEAFPEEFEDVPLIGTEHHYLMENDKGEKR